MSTRPQLWRLTRAAFFLPAVRESNREELRISQRILKSMVQKDAIHHRWQCFILESYSLILPTPSAFLLLVLSKNPKN